MLKRQLVRDIVISNICVKLYRNRIINAVARAMTKCEHTNERTYVRTNVLTYIRTGQTPYPLHNFVVRGDNRKPTNNDNSSKRQPKDLLGTVTYFFYFETPNKIESKKRAVLQETYCYEASKNTELNDLRKIFV